MPFFHLTTRTRQPLAPFLDRDHCADLWSRLRLRFEKAQACVLMPNHVHLVAEFSDPELALSQWVTELGAFSKSRFAGRKLWEPTPPPDLLSGPRHLMRHIRYVHLNPCRAELVSDPLQWEWSTHRDVVGAAFPSWPDLAQLSELWRCRPKDLARVLHAYVSGDPSVSVAGTSLPAARAGSQIVTSFEKAGEAILQAGRFPARTLFQRRSQCRRLGAYLVRELGVQKHQPTAAWLAMSPRAVREIYKVPLNGEEQGVLRAALVLLSNPGRFSPIPKSNFPKARTVDDPLTG